MLTSTKVDATDATDDTVFATALHGGSSTRAAALARPLGAVVRDDLSLDAAAVFLLQHRLTTAPVVAANDALIGFVSVTDLMRERMLEGDTHEIWKARRPRASGFHVEDEHRRRVGDIVVRFVVTLPEDATIAQAAAFMAAYHVHRLVLVSARRDFVGMVHSKDILRWLARCEGICIPDDDAATRRHACANAI